MLKKIIAAAILSASVPAMAFSDDAAERETLEVCANLDMYGAFAIRYRDMGMPKDAAIGQIVATMRKNLKLPLDVTEATVKVVSQIYDLVYLDSSVNKHNVEDVIVKACSRYKGYNIDQQKIVHHLAENPQSAWDPLRRVPLCVKLAQSAANIATARDRGISKEQITKISEAALENDPMTRTRIPTMVDEVFEYSEIAVANFYAYNLARCAQKKTESELKPLADLKPEILKCQGEPTQYAQEECVKGLLGL